MNMIVLSGDNPALYIALLMESQIGAGLHSSLWPVCVIARHVIAVAGLQSKNTRLFFFLFSIKPKKNIEQTGRNKLPLHTPTCRMAIVS